jgi:DnaK suppressor protein
MATPTPTEPSVLDLVATRARLERHLHDRRTALDEMAPRALPTVDPIAYQTAASIRAVIAQITAALARLDDGTYGQCVRCARPIAPERLEAIPHAAACRECQSNAEAA